MIALSIVMAACLAANPNSDEIVARDLLPDFPQLSAIDPATRLGFAPAPGVARTFRVAELRQMAQRFGLSGSPDQEICVQRAVSQLTEDRLLAAMRAALPEGRIEILEHSRQPAPPGDLEFPRESLRVLPSGESNAMWNGFVRYAGSRKFTVWARVKVAVTAQRVVAIGDLPAGRPIEPGQLLLQTVEALPWGNFAESLEQATGKCPRVAIRAGTAIQTSQLVEPKEVSRGDRVQVDVFAGAAHLELEAVAENAGASGEMIFVRNPSSNKRFRVQVEGRGRVSVGSRPKETL